MEDNGVDPDDIALTCINEWMGRTPDAPWSDEHEPLLDLFADLLAAHGASRMLCAPLVAPNDEAFPENYEQTLVGIGRLLHRLLYFAGLGGWDFESVDARPPIEELDEFARETRTPDVSFVGLEAGKLCFQLHRLASGDLVTAALCNEIGEALGEIHRRDGAGPYRGGGPMIPLGDLAKKASAATVFLGFPALTAAVVSTLPHVPELPHTKVAVLAAAEEEHLRPYVHHQVHRVFMRQTGWFASLFGMVGLMGGIAPLMRGSLLGFCATVLGGLFTGAMIGRSWRNYYCGACAMRLRPKEKSCPKCGATLGADRSPVRRVSDLPEEEDDELTREALAASGDAVDDGKR